MTKEFELARLSVLIAAKQGLVEEAQAFAWAKRIYPFNPGQLEAVFEEDFSVSQEDATRILKVIERGWGKESPRTTFYEIEEEMGARHGGLDRSLIIYVCRLAFLERRFDQSVWDALTEPGSGPTESQWLARPFDPSSDLYI